eukprot:9320516-Alexandrium_andersonii.AAC.1
MALSEPLVSPRRADCFRGFRCLHFCSAPPRGMRSCQTQRPRNSRGICEERRGGAVEYSVRAFTPGVAVSSSSSSSSSSSWGDG